MTSADELGRFRSRLYEAYATQHAGVGSNRAATAIYRRDIRPLLPPPGCGEVLDVGCGRGDLVRCLLDDGYRASGIDVSPEQVSLASAAGLGTVRLGDYRDELHGRGGQLAAVTACDFLEHLTKPEALEAFDCVAGSLLPGGIFVGRVPNAVSPLSGYIRHGDFTHETWYSALSVRQLAAAAGYSSVTCRPCPPLASSVAGHLRVLAWQPISAVLKLSLTVETGVRSGHIVTQNLTFAACKGGSPGELREQHVTEENGQLISPAP